MKMVTKYEVEGCWTCDPVLPNKKQSMCGACGTVLKRTPEDGHFNSTYWNLKRNDGLEMRCCPNGCSVKDADRKRKIFNNIGNYCKKGSVAGNYTLDYDRIKAFWMDTKGKIYPCAIRDHSTLCDELWGKRESEIEEQGFVKHSGDCISADKRPNRIQRDAIYKYIELRGGNIASAFRQIEEEKLDYFYYEFSKEVTIA